VELRRAGLPAEALNGVHRQLLERLRATPGVVAASSSDLTPVGNMSWNDEILVDGFTPKSMMDAVTWFNEVSDRYFATLGTRLLAGRDFAATDVPTSDKVAIVNDAWSRHFFGNASPLGRQFRLRSGKTISASYTIVGLVENSKYQSLREDVQPIAYLPSSQTAEAGTRRVLEARAQGSATSLVSVVRQLLRETNPLITVDFQTFSGQLARSLRRERTMAVLSAVFGSVALALAVLGLYGVMSYSVARRRGELGVRIALGAMRAHVVRLVLGEVGVVVLIGLAIGVGGARAASMQVAPFLYGTKPQDWGAYVGAALLLAVVAFFAGLIPAWHASRVDPIEALREQ
jgi:predicted permease